MLANLGVQISFAAADPCANGNLGNCDGYETCTVQERVATLCDLRNHLLAKWAPRLQKAKRIKTTDGKPFEAQAYLNGCIEREAAETNTESLAFKDRLQQCLSGLQDSHTGSEHMEPVPPVFTGIRVRQVDKKFYIAEVTPLLVARLRDTKGYANIDKELVVGAEITEINKKPPPSVSVVATCSPRC